MKKLLKILAGLVVLLITIALIAPYVISTDSLKPKIVATVEKQMGKKIQINGLLRLSFFPVLRVSAGDVVIAAASYQNRDELKTIATVSQLELEIGTWAFITSGNLHVNSFTLVNPDITLQIDKNGGNNWDGPPPSSSETDKDGAEISKKPKELSFAVSLHDFTITNGRVVYIDEKNQGKWDIQSLNLNTKMEDMNSPLFAKVSADINGKNVLFDVSLSSINSIVNDGQSRVDLQLDSELLTLRAQGAVTTPLEFIGKINLQSSSFRSALTWLLPPTTSLPVTLPDSVDIIADADISFAFFNLKKVTLALDNLKAAGDIRIDFAQGITPAIFDIDLNTDVLDLSPFIPATTKKTSSDFSLVSAANAAPDAGWSTTPIDFSALYNAEGNLQLRFNQLKCNQLVLGNGNIKSILRMGKLTLNLLDTEVYEGKGSAQAIIDAENKTISSRIDVKNIQLEPLLKATANNDSLRGKTTASINLSMQGRNEKELATSLSGNGNFKINDGALKGCDIAGMIRDLKGILKPTKDSTKTTDFAELSGTFTAQKGVITNNDLAMKAPLLRLRGNGTVGIGERTVNYHLMPSFVDTAKGQGGADKSGLEMPLLLTGSWDNYNLKFDTKGAFEKLLKDPSQLNKKNIKEQVKSLKGLLKGL
ncbi:MAG: AsmA family protein [Alphaproteobacteria bacterium]|nr:AsmA family protein [Alphaproteobacteria bacterium]